MKRWGLFIILFVPCFALELKACTLTLDAGGWDLAWALFACHVGARVFSVLAQRAVK